MPGRIKSKPLPETGAFKGLKKWANGVLADLVRTHIATAPDLTETEAGTALGGTTATGSGTGTGGTGTSTYYVRIAGTLYTQKFVVDGDPTPV